MAQASDGTGAGLLLHSDQRLKVRVLAWCRGERACLVRSCSLRHNSHRSRLRFFIIDSVQLLIFETFVNISAG